MRCVCLVVASGVASAEQRGARGGVGGGDLILLYRASFERRKTSLRQVALRPHYSLICSDTHTHTNKREKEKKNGLVLKIKVGI